MIFVAVLSFVLNKIIPNVIVASTLSTILSVVVGRYFYAGHIDPTEKLWQGNSALLVLMSAVVSFSIGGLIGYLRKRKSDRESKVSGTN